MMVPEEDSVLDDPMEGGGMLFGDEIRPHAVPNNDDDVLGFARGPALTGYQTCECESEGNGAHEAKDSQPSVVRVKRNPGQPSRRHRAVVRKGTSEMGFKGLERIHWRIGWVSVGLRACHSTCSIRFRLSCRRNVGSSK